MGDFGGTQASAEAAQTNMSQASMAAGADPSAGVPDQTATNRNPGGNGVAQALTAFGGLSGILSSKFSGDTNKRIANDNSQIAIAQGNDAVRAGAFAGNRAQEHARRMEGQERGAMAGQGVISGAGTGGDVLQTTAQGGAMDSLMIQRNAARTALGFNLKSGGDIMVGREAEATGNQNAVANLLNTGSQEWLESDPNYQGFRRGGVNL